jgi:hypothetical protein
MMALLRTELRSRLRLLTLALAPVALAAASCCGPMKQVLPFARTPSEKLAQFRRAFQAQKPPVESMMVQDARKTLGILAQGLPPYAKAEDLGCHGKSCAVLLSFAKIGDLRAHLDPKKPAMMAFRKWKGAKNLAVHVSPARARQSEIRAKGDGVPPAPPAGDSLALVQLDTESKPAPSGATCNWLDSHNSDAIAARRSYHLSPAMCRGFLYNGSQAGPDGDNLTSFHPDSGDGAPWEALQVSPNAPAPGVLGDPAFSIGNGTFAANTLVCPAPYVLDVPYVPSRICATMDFAMAQSSDQTLTCQIRAVATGHFETDYLFTNERYSPEITVPRAMSGVTIDPGPNLINMVVTAPIVEDIDADSLQYFMLDPSSPNVEVLSFELLCQGFDPSDQLLRYRFDFDLQDYEKKGW